MTYFLDFEGTLASAASGELRVYPDAPEFLRMLGNEAIVITRGDSATYRARIESALAGVVRLTILCTDGEDKASFLAKRPQVVSAAAALVDDDPRELERMQAAFPHVRLFEMRRDGQPGDGRFPVVSGLFDLPA